MKKNISLHLIIVILCVIDLYVNALSIQPKFASLTAKGVPINILKQKNATNVILLTSNQLTIDNTGLVSCPNMFDPKNCSAWVVAMDTTTGATDTCKISIVPWTANLSSLNITEVINGGYRIFGKVQDTLFVNYKNYLYKTGGDLKNLIPLSPFPIADSDYYWAYLRTPAGSFIRNERNIYFSKDEKNWQLDYTTKGRGIRNSFSYSYDSLTNTTRLFTHDYSTTGIDTFPHSVYRKTISPLVNVDNTWEKVFTLYSKDQWAIDKTLFPACRHIHTLVIDPYTGHIWIGTGDADQFSHIFYSDDNGNSWKHVGMGSQEWRVLSIWFTEKFVYWSMDSPFTEKIFRISRSVYNSKGFWPDMSQKLTSGYSKANLLYMITSLTDKKYFLPNGVKGQIGDIVLGNPKNAIDTDNSLISINDPELDYRQIVATLPNSALWCNATVIDSKGDKITLIESNSEGHSIDNRPRVFGIKELEDGTADVQELLSTNLGLNETSQFYPYEQDANGNMYFQPFAMNSSYYRWNSVVKTTLNWKDNCVSKGGEIIDESNSQIDTNRKLRLVNYEGDVLQWQQTDSTFNWKTLNRLDLKDTIIVREESKTKYIRALVKKENNSSVASNYIRINKNNLNQIGNLITKIDIRNDLFDFYPNPVSDKLFIHVKNDTTSICQVNLLTTCGESILSMYYDFSNGNDLILDLNKFAEGIYILKISSLWHVTVKKIIVK